MRERRTVVRSNCAKGLWLVPPKIYNVRKKKFETLFNITIEFRFPHIQRITPGIGTPEEIIRNLDNALYILGVASVPLSKANGSASDIWQAPHTKDTLDAR